MNDAANKLLLWIAANFLKISLEDDYCPQIITVLERGIEEQYSVVGNKCVYIVPVWSKYNIVFDINLDTMTFDIHRPDGVASRMVTDIVKKKIAILESFGLS